MSILLEGIFVSAVIVMFAVKALANEVNVMKYQMPTNPGGQHA